VQRGVRETLGETEAFGEALARAVEGKTSAKAINAALKAAAKRYPTRRIAEPVERELLHGGMLGALDSDFEAREGTQIAVESFAALHAALLLARGTDRGFANRPLKDAIERFLQREPLTREVFDEMEAAAKRKAFTVANAASKAMVQTVQRELARQVEQGADLRDFSRHAAERLEAAGWTPSNGSHVETVFRTNVLNTYNGGRARQMRQDSVIDLRPFWQILGVKDSRQRQNHRAVHGVILPATDPFWLEAYPPFGFNCRCRTRSLSIAQGASHVQEGKNFLRYVPDPGFDSGLDQVLAA